MSDGTTIGIWVSEDDNLVDEFDALLGELRGPSYSRSETIKDAMELYMTVAEVLDELDYDMAEPSKRMFVRQALLEQARREADE